MVLAAFPSPLYQCEQLNLHHLDGNASRDWDDIPAAEVELFLGFDSPVTEISLGQDGKCTMKLVPTPTVLWH